MLKDMQQPLQGLVLPLSCDEWDAVDDRDNLGELFGHTRCGDNDVGIEA